MRLLMELNLVSKKKDHKQNMIRSDDSNGGKVVFALLTEVITLYMRPTMIDIR